MSNNKKNNDISEFPLFAKDWSSVVPAQKSSVKLVLLSEKRHVKRENKAGKVVSAYINYANNLDW